MEKTYVLAKGCDDKRHMGDALRHLAMDDMHTGNVERARQHLEAALEYSQEAGDPLGTASVQQQLIYVACAAHDYAHAQKMAEALLQSGRESNRWYVTTHALEALETIAWLQQDYPLARVYGEHAMAIYPETEAVPRSNTLRSLSRTATRQGDFQAARDYLSASVTICQAVDDKAHEAWAYVALATVANKQTLREEARDYMGRGLRLFDMLGESGSMVACLRATALLETQPQRSALLWSAYTRFIHERGYSFSAEEREEIAVARAAIRAVISDYSITVIEARSASMSLREVITFAQESCISNDVAVNGQQSQER